MSAHKKAAGIAGEKNHLGIKGSGRVWHHFGANWSSRQEMKGLEGEKKQREKFLKCHGCCYLTQQEIWDFRREKKSPQNGQIQFILQAGKTIH